MSVIDDFSAEVEAALTNCIVEAVPEMELKYGLSEAAVAGALPRIFCRMGVSIDLKNQGGWNEEEVSTLVHHMCLLIKGAKQWKEERTQGDYFP